MADQSFKIKNGLNLNPVNPSTLTNSENGDIICDINNPTLLKIWNSSTSSFDTIGSGGGGGGGSSYLSSTSFVTTTPYPITNSDLGKLLLVDVSTSSKTIQLPASPALGYSIIIKDHKGNSSKNSIIIEKDASHTIENLNSNYICESNFGFWTFIYDGSGNWSIL